jgi:RND family efflux transporter MFP subunit
MVKKTLLTTRPSVLLGLLIALMLTTSAAAEDKDQAQGPPPVPVRVAPVDRQLVAEQVSLVGSTAAAAESLVAAEISGIVGAFDVKEGDFVKKGALLARLKDMELQLKLKGAVAMREQTHANLENAERELARAKKLKASNTIADSKYEEALYKQQALKQALVAGDAEIAYLKYQIKQKRILAPFDGFVAREHTQVGEWVQAGGPVVTLLDLNSIRITVDVPERYAVMLDTQGDVKVMIKSLNEAFIPGKIYAVLPEGNPDARTFAVRINLPNPDMQIKSGMEAVVRFDLSAKKEALIVPKDAIVSAGDARMVYVVREGQAFPVPVKIKGYYDGNAGVEGPLQPQEQVVIRGNERLRPGQAVQITE